MEIRGIEQLNRAVLKYPNLRVPAARWLKAAKNSQWKTPEEVRNDFPSIDYVKSMGGFVFNLGGNNFRLLTAINFRKQRIEIMRIGTHSEYDEW